MVNTNPTKPYGQAEAESQYKAREDSLNTLSSKSQGNSQPTTQSQSGSKEFAQLTTSSRDRRARYGLSRLNTYSKEQEQTNKSSSEGSTVQATLNATSEVNDLVYLKKLKGSVIDKQK